MQDYSCEEEYEVDQIDIQRCKSLGREIIDDVDPSHDSDCIGDHRTVIQFISECWILRSLQNYCVLSFKSSKSITLKRCCSSILRMHEHCEYRYNEQQCNSDENVDKIYHIVSHRDYSHLLLKNMSLCSNRQSDRRRKSSLPGHLSDVCSCCQQSIFKRNEFFPQIPCHFLSQKRSDNQGQSPVQIRDQNRYESYQKYCLPARLRDRSNLIDALLDQRRISY